MTLINYAPKTDSIIGRKSWASNYAINRPKTKLLSRGRAPTMEFDARKRVCRKFRDGARACRTRAYFVPSRTRYAYRYDIDEPGYKKKKRKKDEKGKKKSRVFRCMKAIAAKRKICSTTIRARPLCRALITGFCARDKSARSIYRCVYLNFNLDLKLDICLKVTAVNHRRAADIIFSFDEETIPSWKFQEIWWTSAFSDKDWLVSLAPSSSLPFSSSSLEELGFRGGEKWRRSGWR